MTQMKTALTIILLLFSATLFAQHTAKPKMNQKNNSQETKPQAKIKKEGWGDVGSAKGSSEYIGETEKNRTTQNQTNATIKNKKPDTNNLSDGDDPFGKTKPMKTNNLGEDDDPFGKTKKNNLPKKKNGYANQEVSY